jgi:hypothetical protein
MMGKQRRFEIRDEVEVREERPINVWLERGEDDVIKMMVSHSSRSPEPHYVCAIFKDGSVHLCWPFGEQGKTLLS